MAEPRAYVVSLGLPPKACSPNARVHWAAKHRAVKKYREAARLTAMGLRNREPLDNPVAHATFYFRVKRTRDADNLLASLKAAFDGLADAGLVRNDSELRHVTPLIVTGCLKQAEKVVITLREEATHG